MMMPKPPVVDRGDGASLPKDPLEGGSAGSGCCRIELAGHLLRSQSEHDWAWPMHATPVGRAFTVSLCCAGTLPYGLADLASLEDLVLHTNNLSGEAHHSPHMHVHGLAQGHSLLSLVCATKRLLCNGGLTALDLWTCLLPVQSLLGPSSMCM